MDDQDPKIYSYQWNQQIVSYDLDGDQVVRYGGELWRAARPIFPGQAFAAPSLDASIHQENVQEKVAPVAPCLPASLLEQSPSASQHHSNFEEQPAIAPEQPRKKLGRPAKPRPLQEGPKRGRGRPAGTVDTLPRKKRGEKQSMSDEERRLHHAELRKARKDRKARSLASDLASNSASNSSASNSSSSNSSSSNSSTPQTMFEDWNQPQDPAPMVPQVPMDDTQIGQQEAWQPQTSMWEDSSNVFFDVGQHSGPQPSTSMLLEPDIDPRNFSGSGVEPLQAAFNPYGQDAFMMQQPPPYMEWSWWGSSGSSFNSAPYSFDGTSSG
ncbi:hypothetical protein DE146DRAFT_750069 [Phaeosphaeria sp. MPI-PUGE-AT-0046c]|nr:hypothetical protein DE146DRAFT_750069 [Phaeosphaeria sp. MPI-PUGE-AT-0046c]